MTQKTTYSFLMLAGAVPFLYAAIAPYFGVRQFPLIGDIQFAINVYILAIISFMSGVHWGMSISVENQEKMQTFHAKLMLVSNVFVVVPWLLLALGFEPLFYVSVLIAFILLRVIDANLFSKGLITPHYFRMRCVISIVVIFSLTLIILQRL